MVTRKKDVERERETESIRGAIRKLIRRACLAEERSKISWKAGVSLLVWR